MSQISITHKHIGSTICKTVGNLRSNTPASIIWKLAGSPNLLAPSCLNLKSFTTDTQIRVGNLIEETHTFLGIEQKYRGKIKFYKEGISWAMYTYPMTLRKFFGLPHFVKYQISEGGLSIAVTYTLEGMLRLPIIRNLVELRMKQAVTKLLRVAG